MSQYDLSLVSNINRAYIGYLENCQHNVSLQKLCQLAEALEIDVNQLLKETVPETKPGNKK